jgi:hypothetical protein
VSAAAAPVLVLLPAAPQRLWGWPAAVNLVAGGLGTGFYVAAAVGARGAAPVALAWLGPLLVLVGFAAVAVEAGRPSRALRVLARARTSWMSREAWLAGAFVAFALAEVVVPGPAPRLLAVAAAVALAIAQGAVLRAARGVAAWGVAVMPALFLSSALVSGTGLLVVVDVARGGPSIRLLGATLALLTVHVVVWWAYLTWSAERAFLEGVRPLRGGRGALAIVGGGYLLPSLCLALAVALPELAASLAALGGALVVLGQAHAKAALVLQAGRLRPITLAPVRCERRAR